MFLCSDRPDARACIVWPMNSRLPPGLRPPVKVALARAVEKIPRSNALPGGALYEPKWDGYRVNLFRDGDETLMLSRQGKDLSRYFPDVIAAAAARCLPAACSTGKP